MAQVHEKLVEEWFRRKGYFTIRGAKAKGSGNSEIDLLALRNNLDGSSCYRHIEVQISFRPIGNISLNSRTKTSTAKKRTKKELEEDVPFWIEKKFKSKAATNIRNSFVQSKVKWIFSLVHHIVKDKVELDILKNFGIELIPFSKIMSELKAVDKRSSDAKDEVELLNR